MILRANKDHSIIGSLVNCCSKGDVINDDTCGYEQIEDSKYGHDNIESELGLVQVDHCGEDKSEEEKSNIDVLNDVSRLKPNGEA